MEVLALHDIGHGMPVDSGASAGGHKEARCVVPIASRTAYYLDEYFGIKNDFTRYEGEFVSLESRVEKAEWWASRGYRVINLSYHLNGFEDTSVWGHETLYQDKGWNKGFAVKINNAARLANAEYGLNNPDRGIKERDDLHVLDKMPFNIVTCLVEPLFITNSTDRAAILDEKYQDILARHLAIAIAEEAGVAQLKAFPAEQEPEKVYEYTVRFTESETVMAEAKFNELDWWYEKAEAD